MYWKRTIPAVLLLVFATSTFAEEASSKKAEVKKEATEVGNFQKTINYLKEKFSATYHGEFYFQRRLPFYDDAKTSEETRFQDLLIMHNPAIIYKPTADWQFLSTAEFKYTDRPNYIYFPNTFYRSLFTLTRKNIKTEKENGFQLDAGIGRRQFNTGLAIASYGNNRIFTTVSKTFGKHNGSIFLQYLNNDYKKTTSTTWRHGFEVIPTVNLQLTDKLSYLFNDDIVINLSKKDNNPRSYYIIHEMNLGYFSYQWNDKISTYYQLKYYHSRYDFTKDYRSDLDFFEHYAGVTYSFTKKFSLTGEIGSEIARASDGRSFFSKKVKYPEFALYVDASL